MRVERGTTLEAKNPMAAATSSGNPAFVYATNVPSKSDSDFQEYSTLALSQPVAV